MDSVQLLKMKASNLTVPHGENIEGIVEWKNHAIDVAMRVLVGFLLRAEGEFVVFAHDGEPWIAGSLLEFSAPGISEVKVDNLPSKAAWWRDGAFGALAFIAEVESIRVLTWEGRIIGVHGMDFSDKIWIPDKFLGFKEFSNVLTVNPPPVALALERFFVLNHPWQFGPEWDAYCWLKNIGGAPVSGEIRWKGEVHYKKGQVVYELDKRQEFTVQPNERLESIWSWSTPEPLDPAWVRIYINDKPIIPRFDWLPGYHIGMSPEELVEVKATHVGTNWAILRYCQRSDCTHWRVSARHPPPIEGPEQHYVYYPTIDMRPNWASTFEHLVTGLWPKSRYEGSIYGYTPGGAHRTGYDIFTTK